jgi:hypothetical protein
MRQLRWLLLIGCVLSSATARAQEPAVQPEGQSVALCVGGTLVTFAVSQVAATPLDDGTTLVTVVLDTPGLHAELVNQEGERYQVNGGPLLWNFALPPDAGQVSLVPPAPATCQ